MKTATISILFSSLLAAAPAASDSHGFAGSWIAEGRSETRTLDITSNPDGTYLMEYKAFTGGADASRAACRATGVLKGELLIPDAAECHGVIMTKGQEQKIDTGEEQVELDYEYVRNGDELLEDDVICKQKGGYICTTFFTRRNPPPQTEE
ncbi:MAG: hypothetical protein IJ523_03095 [Succinivibrionaceae bacterium]|nr:hypothetical protein [Succinivibrionaceae bacterium]